MAIDNYLRTGLVNEPIDLSHLKDGGLMLACNFTTNGVTVPDISGNGKHGTISGAVSITQQGIEFGSVIADPMQPSGYIPRDGQVSFGDIGLVQTVCMDIKWKHAGNTIQSAVFQGGEGTDVRFDLNTPMVTPNITKVTVNGFEGSSILDGYAWDSLVFILDTPTVFTDFRISYLVDGVPIYGNYEIRDLRVWNRALSDDEILQYRNSFGEIILYADFSAEQIGTPIPKNFIVTGGQFSVEQINGNSQDYLVNGDKYVSCLSGPGYIGSPLSYEYGEFEALVYKENQSDIFDWHVVTKNIGPLDQYLYRAPGAFYGETNGIVIRWETDGTFKFYYVENSWSQYNPGAQFGRSERIFEAGEWLKLKLILSRRGNYMLYVNDTLIDIIGVGQTMGASYTSFIVPTGGAIARIKTTNTDYVTPNTLGDVINNFAASGSSQVTVTMTASEYSGNWESWELYRSPNGIAAWTRIATINRPTTTYVDNTTAGEIFYYRARYKRGNQYGDFSGIKQAGGDTLAQPYNFNAFGNGNEGRMLFNWNNNGVTDATSIQPQISTDNISWTTLASLPTGTTQYQALHLGSTKKYYTRVRVVRGVQEVFSKTLLASTGLSIATPSLGLNVISATETEIIWNYGPNSEGEEVWRVFKSIDNELNYNEIYSTTDLGILNYIDTNSGDGVWYKVAADDGRVYQYSNSLEVFIPVVIISSMEMNDATGIDTIVLTSAEVLQTGPSHTPDTAAFTCIVDGQTYDVDSVTVYADRVELKIDRYDTGAYNGAIITLSYDQASAVNDIITVGSDVLTSFAAEPVQNNLSFQPMRGMPETGGTLLYLIYNNDLSTDAGDLPTAAAFTLSEGKTATGVQIYGGSPTLMGVTVDSAYVTGDTITVTYDKDYGGNTAKRASDSAVVSDFILNIVNTL